MELIVLGSGTAVVSLTRGSPAYLVRSAHSTLLIDSGAGTLHKILQQGTQLDEIDAIFYTHIHPDHISDLVPFLFASKYSTSPRQKPLSVFGGKGFKVYFDGLNHIYRKWLEPSQYTLKVCELSAGNHEFMDLNIETSCVNHIPESLAYRFNAPGGSIVFSGDSDQCQELSKIGHNADIYVIECSFPNNQKVKGHLTPQDVAQIAHQAKPKKLVLSHFYPPCDEVDILQEIRKDYSGEAIKAEDGMRIEV